MLSPLELSAAALACTRDLRPILAQAHVASCAGDEQTQVEVDGLFYVFADAEVAIINPTTMTLVANLTADSNGDPLTNAGAVGSQNESRTWNDPAFLQVSTKLTDCSCRRERECCPMACILHQQTVMKAKAHERPGTAPSIRTS